MLDKEPQEITAAADADPLFLDGIQSGVVLTHRAHRPIVLAHVAAGVVHGPTMEGRWLAEDLFAFASGADVDFVADADCPVPVRAVTSSTDPSTVALQIAQAVASTRSELEWHIGLEALAGSNQPLYVDGHLVGHHVDTRVRGVVKTTRARILKDESVLWNLPAGYRSPRFVLPAGFGGPAPERYSCYLRLSGGSTHSWSYGLIRIETHDPDLIDTACATALNYRQPRASRDPRGDRHLAPVAQVEKWLRSRKSALL